MVWTNQFQTIYTRRLIIVSIFSIKPDLYRPTSLGSRTRMIEPAYTRFTYVRFEPLICKSENSLEPSWSKVRTCRAPAHAQFPGQSTSRKLNQSPRRNEFTYLSTLIGYHQAAGVWLFDPCRAATHRRGVREAGIHLALRATRHWSSLISLGLDSTKVSLPLHKDGGRPPSVQPTWQLCFVLLTEHNAKKPLTAASPLGFHSIEIDLPSARMSPTHLAL